MTGMHLLETREVLTDINQLNDLRLRLSFIDELVQQKLLGEEKGPLPAGDRDALVREARRIASGLEDAAARSGLPETPPNLDAVNSFLVEVRMEDLRSGPTRAS